MRYQFSAPHKVKGTSLLELSAIVSLIAILIVVATERIWTLRVDAERIGVKHTLGVLRSALGITVATRLAKGEALASLATLQDSNPVALLKQPPLNYIGEQSHPDPSKIPPHHWYFDTSQHLLIYRVEFTNHFSSVLGAPARIRFRISLSYDDENRNGQFDPQVDTLRNIALVAAEPYTWTAER